MAFYFSWGETFLAIFGEFSSRQIAQIHAHASELFERRPQDVDLERVHGIRASVIPFEMFGYEFVLVLRGDLWTLEVANFPPHAEPGQRIRKARRQREQKECKGRREQEAIPGELPKTRKRTRSAGAGRRHKPKNEDAARVISTIKHAVNTAPRAISLKLYNINQAGRRKLGQLRHTAAIFTEQIRVAIPASQLTVRQQLLRWITPSPEDCQDANIAGWAHPRLPPGFQRERRLLFADFLPMWFDTIAPIEPNFVRSGRSVFGELSMEGECVS